MVLCCKCNRSSKCKQCSCVKAGSNCSNCLPSRVGTCCNLPDVSHEAANLSSHLEPTTTPLSTFDQPTPPEFAHQDHDPSPEMEQQSEQQQQPSISTDEPELPLYPSAQGPTLSWGSVDGMVFSDRIEHCYKECVHWKRNLFKVPSGRAGTAFVKETTRLIRAYAEVSALEGIALKALIVMPQLLLQKSHRTSKTKEHVSQLQRRLQLWEDGDTDRLLHEGRTIQGRLPADTLKKPKSEENEARSFAKHMNEGRVRAALRSLDDQGNGAPLPLDSRIDETRCVRDALLEKHPPAQGITPSALYEPNDPIAEPHPICFDEIDGPFIRRVVLRMDGTAGPSGLDAAGWKCLCTSFGTHSVDLCESISALTKRICATYVDPTGLHAFVACKLIALDKRPGVRPIGIGETLRRIVGKAVSISLKSEIQAAVGPIQSCAGYESGCEAAVHALNNLFNHPCCEAAIQVDASNAFNCLNRKVALRNILHLCPSLAKILINTYRNEINLHIGGETILSQEGTTQGDPLAMAMYAIGTAPLIRALSKESVKQVWYADDASAAGGIKELRRCWDLLVRIGPNYGYYPNASKTWLIVKPDSLLWAQTAFKESGVSITSEGRKHLGAAIGTEAFRRSYVTKKVDSWTQDVMKLTRIAESQPHAAYAAYTHGLSSKWNYLSRTIADTAELFIPLEKAVREHLLPTLTGQVPFSDDVQDLLALPARMGGLGISNPVKQLGTQFNTSRTVTAPLVKCITDQLLVFPTESKVAQRFAKQEAISAKRQTMGIDADNAYTSLPNSLQKAVDMAKEKGASTWLSALPITEHGFALHKGAFKDALCLRYGWRPPRLPSKCVCDKTFTVEHALSCHYGGFPTIRHNEVRNITAHLMSDVCHNVGIKPTLQPLSTERLFHQTANTEDGARLDIKAQGFWENNRQSAFFDVRVFNPLADTYRSLTLPACYRRHEQEKKRAYDQRIREVEHGCFSPLIFSASGGMGPIAKVVYQKLAGMISSKHNQPYSQTVNWLRCRLSFSLLRSAIMCIRGSRSSSKSPAKPQLYEAAIDRALSDGKVATE